MSLTPIRRQYLRIKQRYPHAIVFFRLGDFYETFDDDAKITARELEITLTAREMGKGQRIPLAGIPYHAIDNYLAKLINKGYKVAICEQMSSPGKGLVEREVIRVVTPGTVIEPVLLSDKNNNYLVAIAGGKENIGIAYVDITTGEFATTEVPFKQLNDELTRLQPAELLISQEMDNNCVAIDIPITKIDEYWFDLEISREILLKHFGSVSLDSYGCAQLPLAIKAAGIIIHYVEENQKAVLRQIDRLSTYTINSYMTIDTQTRRNLELFTNARRETASGSFLSVLDLTKTPMGGRQLRKWIGQPLIDLKNIVSRQYHIQWFYLNNLSRQEIISVLDNIADLERLINRTRSNLAIPRDLIALGHSLVNMGKVKTILDANNAPADLRDSLNYFNDVIELIGKAIMEEPGVTLERGGVIRAGFSIELDDLRSASLHAKNHLASLEKQEREKTGVKSLKVGYNRVFGYYIEISKANLNLVPAEYIRKQTLTNGERFFTPELKEYESIILNTQERIADLETIIFRQVCQQIALTSEQILCSAKAIAEIDVFSSLAEVAARNGYVRPELNDGKVISIKSGRHPVVEKNLGRNEFIPNDTYLCNEDHQIIILTGPNMSGKSTYLKQVALITLMAQIGSYVPADMASIGLVDRIFTRIGAQEDLAAGQSTFMVEMIETANILNNATSKSLIILDEVGRGTSTYDGLSIAWALVEFVHSNPRLRAKTLFATHYHELVELATSMPKVRNFNVAVTEEDGKVVFLRKIVPGGADRSYGIHVAQLAGLPNSVIHRAQEILIELETNRHGEKDQKPTYKELASPQLSLFSNNKQFIEEIAKIDVDSMSPIEAIAKLYELKKKAQESKSIY